MCKCSLFKILVYKVLIKHIIALEIKYDSHNIM